MPGSLLRYRKQLVFLILAFLIIAVLVSRLSTRQSFPLFGVSSPATSKTTAASDQAAAAEYIFDQQREAMVETGIKAWGVKDERVLEVMKRVPRHEFVPPEYLDSAYENHPLPIGYGQTISQPFIVAWMTELLELTPGERVLEIGTGSGYQAAVLAELPGVEVYTIEIVPELAISASERLKKLGYAGVQTRQGDGYYGWPEAAPFDAIIVTAAPDHLPAPLIQQLNSGGCLVIPIGPAGGMQSLWKFVNEGQYPPDPENLKAYNLGPVSFVPFTGGGISGAATQTAPP